MPKPQLIDIFGHIHHETEAAVLFSDTGEEEAAVWLPKSQCEIEKDPERNNLATVTLSTWLAEKKELV